MQVPRPTDTPIQQACFQLLTPTDGTILSDKEDLEKITFSWQSVEGAANYRVDVLVPVGQTVTFNFNETSRDIYMQNIQLPGRYEWQVTAEDANGSAICSSETFSFERPE
jgi:hypothetical protein